MTKFSRAHLMTLIKILKRKTKILPAKRNKTNYKANSLKMNKSKTIKKVKNNNKTIMTLYLKINIT